MKDETKTHDKSSLIIVNATEHEWTKKEITFEEVIVLAYASYNSSGDIAYTVTYFKGPNTHHEGSLVKGQSAHVKDGMIFNVTQTNKS